LWSNIFDFSIWALFIAIWPKNALKKQKTNEVKNTVLIKKKKKTSKLKICYMFILRKPKKTKKKKKKAQKNSNVTSPSCIPFESLQE
jgi:hypothetical protein